MIPPQSLAWRQTCGLETVCFLGNQWLFWRYSMPLDWAQLYLSGLQKRWEVSWPPTSKVDLGIKISSTVTWILHMKMVPKAEWSSYDGSKPKKNKQKNTFSSVAAKIKSLSRSTKTCSYLSSWCETWQLQSWNQLFGCPHTLCLSSCHTESNRSSIYLKWAACDSFKKFLVN